jgi:Golgi nucleoside diphosphatase
MTYFTSWTFRSPVPELCSISLACRRSPESPLATCSRTSGKRRLPRDSPLIPEVAPTQYIIHENKGMTEFGYGCVVDAGSSGSRIFLYRWPKQGGGPTEEVFNEERTPGISDPEHGLEALQELVALAENALPQHHGADAHDVPIYLGATAGLRLIESGQRDTTMVRIRDLLHDSEFLFRDEWARVISGEEEGIYDWLTINYIKNGKALPNRSSTTYGALDLGGASTQISFSTQRRLLRSNEAFPLQIDDSNYLLYSRSFLHYGVDEARSKHARHIAANESNNPCYPVGYIDEVNANLPGSSNWDECLLSVSQIFDPANCLDDGEPCFDSTTLTQLAHYEAKFVATSAFVFAWDFLQLKTGTNTDDLATLNKQAKEICNLDFSQQLKLYKQYKMRRSGSSVRTTTKPHAQCFNAAYSYHLLSKGYSMPISNTPIEVDDIKSWTLGMMLVEANNLTKKISNGELHDNLFYAYKCVFAGSTLVLMLLMSFLWRRRRWRVPLVNKAQTL